MTKHPKITSNCKVCGAPFKHYRGKPRPFCSRECSGKAQALIYAQKRIACVCEACGAKYTRRPYLAARNRFCSSKCKQGHVARETAKARGDATRGKGRTPDGALRPTTYRKLMGRHEHRVIAEQKMGRKLERGEVVHHINGNRHDNRPENLVVITQSQHIELHRKDLKR